jgi:hypothetical protein
VPHLFESARVADHGTGVGHHWVIDAGEGGIRAGQLPARFLLRSID